MVTKIDIRYVRGIQGGRQDYSMPTSCLTDKVETVHNYLDIT